MHTQKKFLKSESSVKNWIFMKDTEMANHGFVQKTVKIDFNIYLYSFIMGYTKIINELHPLHTIDHMKYTGN